MKTTEKLPAITICVLLFTLSACQQKTANTNVGENDTTLVFKLSNKIYVDPKGYFKIVPPIDWTIQEYPDDSRGKVAFICPEQQVDLRILTNAVEYDSIDDLISFCKDVEGKININTNIEEITFWGMPAVKREFEMNGMKFYYIDILINRVDHNIAYSANVELFDKYYDMIKKSIDTYELINIDVTDDIIRKNAVDKNKRLAKLMIENGNLDLAMEYVEQGLLITPNDTSLLKLKTDIGHLINK
jgi:hypothetical protein